LLQRAHFVFVVIVLLFIIDDYPVGQLIFVFSNKQVDFQVCTDQGNCNETNSQRSLYECQKPKCRPMSKPQYEV